MIRKPNIRPILRPQLPKEPNPDGLTVSQLPQPNLLPIRLLQRKQQQLQQQPQSLRLLLQRKLVLESVGQRNVQMNLGMTVGSWLGIFDTFLQAF